jgi:type II secretory pathway pseudopilin PulG
MTQTMGFRTTLRSESGFAIIEAVVSAAVLGIIALAVLSGIDAASSSTGREKARSVAASLAEQDQERLRALTVNQLSGLDVTQTVTVDKVGYQVRSQAQWITDDSGGTPACGNSSKNNEYLHITSTVSSSLVGVRVPAVKIDSLAAPSAEYSSTHGILGVKVVNRNAVGVPGITVSAASTTPAFAPPSQVTDANGCVIFRQIPVATYTITLDQAGYVGTELAQLTTVSQKATPGNVTFKTIEYDLATTARVTVMTTPPGASTPQQNSKAAKISLTNAKVTGLVKSYTNAAPASPLDVKPLYPFKSTSYGFFTGSCAYQSPDKYTASYFGTNPGSLLMDPTLPQPQAVTVLQPPFNLRMTRNSSSSSSAANLAVYAKLNKSAPGDTCTEAQVPMSLQTWPSGASAGTWGAAPGAATTNWVVQTGATFDPGMPYGNYQICVKDTAANRYQSFAYDNTAPGGAGTTANNNAPLWTPTNCIG